MMGPKLRDSFHQLSCLLVQSFPLLFLLPAVSLLWSYGRRKDEKGLQWHDSLAVVAPVVAPVVAVDVVLVVVVVVVVVVAAGIH